MTCPTVAPWVVLIPVKRAEVAKSRLTGVTPQQRADLARAFPADCAAAALRSSCVGAVVAITDDPAAADMLRGLGADVIPDEPDAGLNPALEHAATHVRRDHPGAPMAVLSGDLPALRPQELTLALSRAGRHVRAFVADEAGVGTTLLTAAPDTDLAPRFGARSRRAHLRSGADELDPSGLDSVRSDVDTPSDLRAAAGLGVGRHTVAVLRRHGIDPAALH